MHSHVAKSCRCLVHINLFALSPSVAHDLAMVAAEKNEVLKLTVPQLREALASRSLSTEGLKAVLVARLQAKLDEERALEAAAVDHAVVQEGRPAQGVELASDEVVARVVALQEAVEGSNLDRVVADAAVAEAVDFIMESQAHGDGVIDEQSREMEPPNHLRVVDMKNYVTSSQTCTQDVLMNDAVSPDHPLAENVALQSVSGTNSAPEEMTINNPLAVNELPAIGENLHNDNNHQSPPAVAANVTTTWDIQFNKLKAYKLQHGNCKVPKLYPPDPQLGRWVNTQRYKNNTRSLNAAKKAKLDAIHFEWNLREPNRSWKKWLKELLAFKAHHGHVNVPQRCKTNKALGAFVSNLRSEYRKYSKGQNSFLTPKRIQILEDLGFQWVARKGVAANGGDAVDEATLWETRFTELKGYKERFGDCNVPKRWRENPSLADWVEKQRQQYKRSSLSTNKIRDLDALGFNWNIRAATWNTMMSELIKYKEEFGHCDVPKDWERSPYLGEWVDMQRKKYRNLTKERIVALIELGFDFKVLNPKIQCTETKPTPTVPIASESKLDEFLAESPVVPTLEKGGCVRPDHRIAVRVNEGGAPVEV
eukprot:CCRYP_013062-RA/>CCRYP_013062-RA protein AED:0.06 eAED:0.06 QI:124/1/1/1/1/1/4/548/592